MASDAILDQLLGELEMIDTNRRAILQANSDSVSFEGKQINLLTLGKLRVERENLVKRIQRRRKVLGDASPIIREIVYENPDTT